jgi:hypothetical protein
VEDLFVNSCVYHLYLCVLGALVSGRSVCEVMCISSICVCAWCSCQWKICLWNHVYIIYLCVCLVLLSVEYLFMNSCVYRLFLCVLGALVSGRSVCEVFTNRSFTDKSTKHTHTNRRYSHIATYHVNIQRTEISGRQYSNGTKPVIWPFENGRIKMTETYKGLLMFTNFFNILLFLNFKINIF